MVQLRKREVVSGDGGIETRGNREMSWGGAGGDNTFTSTVLSELPAALTPYRCKVNFKELKYVKTLINMFLL